jgi:hypothetical protein
LIAPGPRNFIPAPGSAAQEIHRIMGRFIPRVRYHWSLSWVRRIKFLTIYFRAIYVVVLVLFQCLLPTFCIHFSRMRTTCPSCFLFLDLIIITIFRKDKKFRSSSLCISVQINVISSFLNPKILSSICSRIPTVCVLPLM